MNPYQIGDVLVSSWGYDQTNVNYFQVVWKSEKSIRVKEIGSRIDEDGFMCGHAMPVKNEFVDRKWLRIPPEGKLCRVSEDGWVRIDDVIHAHKWDGQPNYVSWYA